MHNYEIMRELIFSKRELKVALKLFRAILRYWQVLLLVFLSTLIYNLTNLTQPLLFKSLFEIIFQTRSIMALNLLVVLALGLYLLRGIAQYGQHYLLNLVNSKLVLELQNSLYYRILRLRLAEFDRGKLGDLVSRMLNDIGLVAGDLGNLIIVLVNGFVTVIGALAWIIYKDISLALVTLVILPLVAVVINKLSNRMGKVTQRYQAKLADLSSVMTEGLMGIKTVKAYVAEEVEQERFQRQTEQVFNSRMKMVQVLATQRPLIEFIASLGIIAISWYGGYLVVRGILTPGDVLAYWGYVAISVTPLTNIGKSMLDLKKVLVAANRVFELAESEEQVEGGGKLDASNVKGAIEFEDVWLSYNGQDYELKGLSFKVEPGQVVAIVGPTGAGKTSIISLLLRFYEPTRGRIKIDGIDIREYDLRSLRGIIGVMLQEPFIFNASIVENISYPVLRTEPDEKVINAARMAQIHDYIVSLPNGYKTLISERGQNLSGGQRQRLALARLFMRSPKIIVLDEPTSALDINTERRLKDAFEKLFRDRTVLLITHRHTLLELAHKVLVIENGKLVKVCDPREFLGTSLNFRSER